MLQNNLFHFRSRKQLPQFLRSSVSTQNSRIAKPISLRVAAGERGLYLVLCNRQIKTNRNQQQCLKCDQSGDGKKLHRLFAFAQEHY